MAAHGFFGGQPLLLKSTTDIQMCLSTNWRRYQYGQGLMEFRGGLMKKKELAEKVAKNVGDPPYTVVVKEGRINPSKYLRARVFIDLKKPLVRFVPVALKERKKYPVQYDATFVA